MADFSNPYSVSVPVAGKCEVNLGGKRMKEVKGLKYLGMVS